jgi:hypothetical protein
MDSNDLRREGERAGEHDPGPVDVHGDPWDGPWLVGDPARDRDVLYAFAVIQESGLDPFDAHGVAAALGLTDAEFDSSLYRLIHAGLVTGGRFFARAFVETVTEAGLAAAGIPRTRDSEARPPA